MRGSGGLGCLAWRFARSLSVSGWGRTGKTRLSNDEIVLLLFSSARRLCGGSTIVVVGVGVTEVEVEQRTEVIEQEDGEAEEEEDVRKVNF